MRDLLRALGFLQVPRLALLLALQVTLSSASAMPLEPCRIKGVAREVRCGFVTVAENPDAPDAPDAPESSRKIQVQFAVVPALAKRSAPDPVFIFAGGPGQSAISVAPQVLATQALLNARRDLVFIDQRGTGRSNKLGCVALEDTAPLARILDSTAHLARLDACVRDVLAQGQDTRQYATWIAVRDIDAVRIALGHERINLWASSYGTRAALEYLRQFSAHVRSAVLDGVVPPDAVLPQSFARDNEAALQRLITACNESTLCHAQHPHLAATIDQLLARADAGTLRYTATHPITGQQEQLTLDRTALVSSLRAPLYAPALAATLPYALERAAAGNANALIAVTQALSASASEALAEVMHFAVVCAEDMPRMKGKGGMSSRFARTLVDLYRHVCTQIPVRTVPREFFSLSDAEVPVLLLSGGADPATPPRHGEALRSQLKNARHLIAPHLSHGVAHYGCAPELIHRFMRQASFDNIEDTCLKQIPAVPFFSPPQAIHD